jgi:anti-sigma factor RsiW
MDQEERLLAYVDGQLEPDEIAAVEQLLAADPAARQQVRVFRETASLLRAACADPFYASPPVMTAWAPQRPKPAWHEGLMRRAAAILLLVAAGFGSGQLINLNQSTAYAALMGEVSDYHRFFAADQRHMAEVPPERGGELVAWLHQVGLEAEPFDLGELGYAFAGGRVYVTDDKPIAEFFYTRPGQAPIGICVTKGGEGRDIRFDQRDGTMLATWGAGGQTFVVVGAPDQAETRRLAQRLWTATRA